MKVNFRYVFIEWGVMKYMLNKGKIIIKKYFEGKYVKEE